MLSTFTVTNTADSGAGQPPAGPSPSPMERPDPTRSNSEFPAVTWTPSTSKSALPTITTPVTIDGTSQPGYAGTPRLVIRTQAPRPAPRSWS